MLDERGRRLTCVKAKTCDCGPIHTRQSHEQSIDLHVSGQLTKHLNNAIPTMTTIVHCSIDVPTIGSHSFCCIHWVFVP